MLCFNFKSLCVAVDMLLVRSDRQQWHVQRVGIATASRRLALRRAYLPDATAKGTHASTNDLRTMSERCVG